METDAKPSQQRLPLRHRSPKQSEVTIMSSEDFSADDNCAQLRILASRLLLAENICKDRIAVVQNTLAALQSDMAFIEHMTASVTDQLAKAECLEFTHQVTTKLPREIRDMIYLHLSTQDRVFIQREHYRLIQDPVTKLYSHDTEMLKADNFLEHYWNKDHVSPQFFHELAENYYRTSTFFFPANPSIMQRFLTTDSMKLGIPPKSLISSVEIELNAISEHGGSRRVYLQNGPKTCEEMRDALEGMFELREGAKVVVRLVTEADTQEQREEMCTMAIAMMFDEKQLERMKAYNVELVLDDGQGSGRKKEEWRVLGNG